MKRLLLTPLIASCIFTPAYSAEPTPPATAEGLVNAFQDAFGGAHPKMRRTHAKGICFSGTFLPSDQARKNFDLELTNANKILKVIGRFSIAGGDPQSSDKARSPRGMALRFYLQEDKFHQMAMLSTPVFAAATPDSFLGLLQAQRMDPTTKKRNAEKITAYIQSHPDTQPQAQFLKEHNPPASFAQSQYFGISTFLFKNKGKGTTPVRWFFAPEEGEKLLTAEQMEKGPDQFLETELKEHVSKKPAVWNWTVMKGNKDDNLINPTIPWNIATHKTVKMGELKINKVEDTTVCDDFNFDPLVLSKGVEASEDPILRIRSGAYAISFGRRQTEKSQDKSQK